MTIDSSTTARQHGLYFSLSLENEVHLDVLAAELSQALATDLVETSERGTAGDYVGHLLGLHLWLFIAEPRTERGELRIALVGGAEYDRPPATPWLDIGAYLAELVRSCTGRSWTHARIER